MSGGACTDVFIVVGLSVRCCWTDEQRREQEIVDGGRRQENAQAEGAGRVDRHDRRRQPQPQAHVFVRLGLVHVMPGAHADQVAPADHPQAKAQFHVEHLVQRPADVLDLRLRPVDHIRHLYVPRHPPDPSALADAAGPRCIRAFGRTMILFIRNVYPLRSIKYYRNGIGVFLDIIGLG